MRVILVDSDPGAMEALADHIRRAEPQAEIVAFTSREELARWMEEDGGNTQRDRPRLRVQTFGNFEVFYDGKPVHFRRRRTKELFAYLIDRRGAGSTMGQLISVLWEGRPDTDSVRSQLRSLITDLRTTFRDLEENSIIIKQRDLIAVDPDRVDCDYYRFLRGEVSAVNRYQGEFMAQYSWAEFVTGYIEQKTGK